MYSFYEFAQNRPGCILSTNCKAIKTTIFHIFIAPSGVHLPIPTPRWWAGFTPVGGFLGYLPHIGSAINSVFTKFY